MAGCVCVRFASRLCCLFCSFPSTTRLCWKVERSVADWISCTLKRPSWIRSTTDERLDCPTPHTLTSWEHTHTPCSEQSGGGGHWLWCSPYLMAISPFFQPVGDESQARVVEHVGHKPGDWVGLWSEDLHHQQLSTGLTMFAFKPANLLISPLFFRVWLQAQGPCWVGGGVGSPQAEVTVTTVSLFRTFFFWPKEFTYGLSSLAADESLYVHHVVEWVLKIQSPFLRYFYL